MFMMQSATSYILGLGMLNSAQRYVFMDFALTCDFYFCFPLSAGFFLTTLLCRWHIQTSWLGTWLCLNPAPRAVCVNAGWQPASSFRLNFGIWQTSRLNFRNSFDPLGPDPESWSTRPYCRASAQSQWWQRGTDGSRSSSRAFRKGPHGN